MRKCGLIINSYSSKIAVNNHQKTSSGGGNPFDQIKFIFASIGVFVASSSFN